MEVAKVVVAEMASAARRGDGGDCGGRRWGGRCGEAATTCSAVVYADFVCTRHAEHAVQPSAC